MRLTAICLMILATPLAAPLATPLAAQHSHGGSDTPYAGLQSRGIASLSDADIAEIEAGRGWGLALPAELNGYPGPVHVLELTDALGLSAAQRDEIGALFDAMQAEAIASGAALIAAERALDQAFADGSVTPETLRARVMQAAEARGALRLVHLSRHLGTVDLLTESQIARYQVLRGYADDPCAAVPEGHDATMWRRHNGCE